MAQHGNIYTGKLKDIGSRYLTPHHMYFAYDTKQLFGFDENQVPYLLAPYDNNIIKVIEISENDLLTVDEAGVVSYLNEYGFTKNDNETIIIDAGSKYFITGLYKGEYGGENTQITEENLLEFENNVSNITEIPNRSYYDLQDIPLTFNPAPHTHDYAPANLNLQQVTDNGNITTNNIKVAQIEFDKSKSEPISGHSFKSMNLNIYNDVPRSIIELGGYGSEHNFVIGDVYLYNTSTFGNKKILSVVYRSGTFGGSYSNAQLEVKGSNYLSGVENLVTYMRDGKLKMGIDIQLATSNINHQFNNARFEGFIKEGNILQSYRASEVTAITPFVSDTPHNIFGNVKINNNDLWHKGNLINVSSLVNDPGYIGLNGGVANATIHMRSNIAARIGRHSSQYFEIGGSSDNSYILHSNNKPVVIGQKDYGKFTITTTGLTYSDQNSANRLFIDATTGKVTVAGELAASGGSSLQWNEAYTKIIRSAVFTGDTNKTLTLTFQDGNIITASFLDNDTNMEFPDDVINTIAFNENNDGVFRAVTSEGAIITVSLDGRYSLLGHIHNWNDIEGKPLTFTPNPHTHIKADITDFYESDYIHTTGDETKTGSLTIDGNVNILTSEGQQGLYLYRFQPTPDEYIKHYLLDIEYHQLFQNDERHGSFIWTINNTDTETYAGAEANTHTLEFLGNETGGYLFLNGEPFASQSWVNSLGFITGVSWAEVTGKPSLYSGWDLGVNGTYRGISSGNDVNFVSGSNVSILSNLNDVIINSTDRYHNAAQLTSSGNLLLTSTNGAPDVSVNLNTKYSLVGHTHAWSEITGKPTLYSGWDFGVNGVFRNIGAGNDINILNGSNVTITTLGNDVTLNSTDRYHTAAELTSSGNLRLSSTNGAPDVTVNLDAKYSKIGHAHTWAEITGKPSMYSHWSLLVNGTIQNNIDNGENVNFVAGSNTTISYASNALTIASTDRFHNAAELTSSGNLRISSTNGLADITVNLDTKYSLIGHTHGWSDITGKPIFYEGWDFSVNGGTINTINNREDLNFVAGTGMTILYDGTNLTFNAASTVEYLGWDLNVNGVNVNRLSSGEDLNFVAGTAITLGYDSVNGNLTINSTDKVHDAGSLTSSGNLRLTSTSGAADLVVPLDGRWSLLGHAHTWTEITGKPIFYEGWDFSVNGGTVNRLNNGENLNLVAGNNISISYVGDDVTITSTASTTDRYHTAAELTSSGNLRLTSTNGAPDVTVNLDTKYSLVGHTHNFDFYDGWDFTAGGVSNRINSGEDLIFVAGSNIGITYVGDTVTFSSTASTTDRYHTAAELTSSGNLRLSSTNGAPDVTVNLDAKYLKLDQLYGGWDLGVNGVYGGVGNGENVNFVAGSGISLSKVGSDITITNTGGTTGTEYLGWDLNVNGTNVNRLSSGEDLGFVAGTGISLSYASGNITVSATGGGGTADGNSFHTSAEFTSTGNYRLLSTNGAPTITTNLDGRYAKLTGDTFTGNVIAPGFYEPSLRRFKENIKPLNKSGLDLVNKLEIVTFDRKDKAAINKIGIIADESPEEFLTETKDGVDLYKTIFIQAKAIQELTARIEELETLFQQIVKDGKTN